MTDVFEFAETERRDLIYDFVTLTPEEIEEKRAKAAAADVKRPAAAKPVADQSPSTSSPASSVDEGDKAAKLAELQRKMAEAKARREAGGEAPVAEASAPTAEQPVADEKAAKLAELQRKMAEAKARREAGGEAPGAEGAPVGEASAPTAEQPGADEKAAKIAELQRKMAEAKARREAGETKPNDPSSSQ